jgi:hypothetical protein
MDALVAWIDETRAGDIASILGLLAALIGFCCDYLERASLQSRRPPR